MDEDFKTLKRHQENDGSEMNGLRSESSFVFCSEPVIRFSMGTMMARIQGQSTIVHISYSKTEILYICNE
jgi:hypothetical protein